MMRASPLVFRHAPTDPALIDIDVARVRQIRVPEARA
jgi:hypothetical protein